MKQAKTTTLIEKIFPTVKDDLRKIVKFAKENPHCHRKHFTPEFYPNIADPPNLEEFATMIDQLTSKIQKEVPNKYTVSMHNDFSHYEAQLVMDGYSGGPRYIHIVIDSKEEGEYCFSSTGSVYQHRSIIGRISKSGKIHYGRISYGGRFMYNETIKQIEAERKLLKAQKGTIKKKKVGVSL